MKQPTFLLSLACGLLLVGTHPASAQTPPPLATPTPAGLPLPAATATPTPIPRPVRFVASAPADTTPTPAPAGGTTPQPTPAVGTTPAPTPTPGGPVLPTAEVARAQAGAVSQVRRLIRDVQSNTDSIKAVGSFGAQLYLIGDVAFYQDWKKPETPTITPVQLALRDQPLYTVIIFYGPARDAKGLCNVSYDVTVKRPDGSVIVENKSMVGWQNLAPDDRELQLGRTYLTITLAPTDPAGLYTVDAIVHDNVGRVDLPLKQTFAVQ